MEVQGKQSDTFRLGQCLLDPKWTVRASAATALGVIGGKKCKSYLLEALKREKEPVVRRDLILALGRVGDEKTANYLDSLLLIEKHSLVRIGLSLSMYQLGKRQALSDLLAQFAELDSLEKSNVINGLSYIVLKPEDISTLTEWLTEERLASLDHGNRGDAEELRERIIVRSDHRTHQGSLA